MQLHAWINPYRITNNSADNKYLAKSNPAVLNPGLVLTDSDGKMYYNPGDSASVDLIVRGAAEIAENYDVDGIHMDDYFYPNSSFDDDTTYSFHKDQYPDKADWRRSNVDKLVKAMDEKLHSIKPEIQFGISPRGIWANKSDMAEGSDTRGGGSYTEIYADSRKWVKEGWVDYIMPPAWTGENGTNELRTHILDGRNNPEIGGYCCFTYNTFLQNRSIYALMQEMNSEAVNAPQGAVRASGDNNESVRTEDNSGDTVTAPSDGGSLSANDYMLPSSIARNYQRQKRDRV